MVVEHDCLGAARRGPGARFIAAQPCQRPSAQGLMAFVAVRLWDTKSTRPPRAAVRAAMPPAVISQSSGCAHNDHTVLVLRSIDFSASTARFDVPDSMLQMCIFVFSLESEP